jgi:hypothetical protein
MPMLETTTIPSLDAEPDNTFGREEAELSAASDRLRHWKPLLDTLGSALAEQFEWKAETDTIQTYEHLRTFRYIHIDGETNCFYNQQCVPITKEAALAHAMPPAAPVKVAQNSAPAPAPGIAESPEHDDLQLAAFTRPVPTEPVQAAWIEFDRATAKNWMARMRQAVADARKGIFQHASDDSGSYPAGAGLVQAGGARDFQEPSLTRFTRRST